jgi:hypothetical protein
MALQDSTNPLAGVSGPGPFSKRVDLEYQSPEYGAGVAYDANKSAAPLEKAAKTPAATPTQIQQAAASMAESGSGLYDPTPHTNRPITTGVDIGEGPGSEALLMRKSSEKTSDVLAKLLPFDTTGEIAILYQEALARGN